MVEDEYPVATGVGLNKDSIYKIAEHVAKQLRYEPGDDLKSIVEKLGGNIKISPTTSDMNSGSIYIHSKNKFDIYLAADTGQTRDRFTIAHELGHYVLHFLWKKDKKSEDISKLRANRYDSTRAEWEANWFAAAFLMPEAAFTTAYKEAGGNINVIARKFGVSAHAAEVRAKALTLID